MAGDTCGCCVFLWTCRSVPSWPCLCLHPGKVFAVVAPPTSLALVESLCRIKESLFLACPELHSGMRVEFYPVLLQPLLGGFCVLST